jgi:hypothetical protein
MRRRKVESAQWQSGRLTAQLWEPEAIQGLFYPKFLGELPEVLQVKKRPAHQSLARLFNMVSFMRIGQ